MLPDRLPALCIFLGEGLDKPTTKEVSTTFLDLNSESLRFTKTLFFGLNLLFDFNQIML